MTWEPDEQGDRGAGVDVYGQAAALYVALLKGGHLAEAAEFAEWFLESFDFDLEN